MPNGADLMISINAQGRLQSVEEFGEIVLKTGDQGQVARLRDVARIELASSQDALRALLDGEKAVALPIFKAPGSNALEGASTISSKKAEMAEDSPEGMT